MIELNEEEQKRFDSWSKEEIYEAYVIECNKCKLKGHEIKRLGVYIAGLEYDLKNVKDLEDDKVQ